VTIDTVDTVDSCRETGTSDTHGDETGNRKSVKKQLVTVPDVTVRGRTADSGDRLLRDSVITAVA